MHSNSEKMRLLVLHDQGFSEVPGFLIDDLLGSIDWIARLNFLFQVKFLDSID